MKPIYTSIIMLVLILAYTNQSLALERPCQGTVEEVNQCMKRELLKVERKLNAKYKHVLTVLSEPDDDIQTYSVSKKAVIESQKAWVKFRQKDCDAQGTMLLPPTGFGAYSLHTQCMIDYADIRIKRLDQFDPDTFKLSPTIN